MDPVSNVDRLVLILRQQLEERAARGATAPTSAPKPAGSTRASNLRALAALDGVDDAALGRTIIEGILTDAFGAELLNDARFQQVVERVTRTIEEEQEAKRLLLRLVGAVRRGGGLSD